MPSSSKLTCPSLGATQGVAGARITRPSQTAQHAWRGKDAVAHKRNQRRSALKPDRRWFLFASETLD
jgi:hypothetical protein